MRQTYESWVHGHTVQLERVGSSSVRNKASALGAYSSHVGDLVGIGDVGGAACFRIGWAARFVVLDLGSGNAPKTGAFWVHYAVPTPSSDRDSRLIAKRAMVNYESSNIAELSIASLHVWDGNIALFQDDRVSRASNNFNGGISGLGARGSRPDKSKLLTGELNDEIFFGVGVSLLISANSAQDEFLEIRGVGVEFLLEDR